MSSTTAKSKRRPARSLDGFLRDVREAAGFAKDFQAELRKDYPRGLNSTHIFRAVQAMFEADVARRNDLPNYIALRKLRQADRAQDEGRRQRERGIEQRERQLELAREKFEFSAAEAVLDGLPELRRIADDRSLHRPDKIQAVRRRLFGEQPSAAADPSKVLMPLRGSPLLSGEPSPEPHAFQKQ